MRAVKDGALIVTYTMISYMEIYENPYSPLRNMHGYSVDSVVSVTYWRGASASGS